MRIIFATLALLATLLPHRAVVADDATATLSVTIENLKSRKGQVVVALFANDADYLKKPVAEAILQIGESLTSITRFTDLPAGRYAVAAYHDRNGNANLDTFLGIPREDYGFSNDARSLLGPPSFEAAAVQLGEGQELDITIRSK